MSCTCSLNDVIHATYSLTFPKSGGLLLVIFGSLPAFHNHEKTLGGLSYFDVYVPVLIAALTIALTCSPSSACRRLLPPIGSRVFCVVSPPLPSRPPGFLALSW